MKTTADELRRAIDRRIAWGVHVDGECHQFLGTGPVAEQGWKLHISATPGSAASVFDSAVGVLFNEGARFKVVNSLDRMFALNAGEFGLSQLGKFLTVYPSDDDHAVRLAALLDERTRGSRGPRIPSDRRLNPGSLVHYRYGAMFPRANVPDGDVSGAYDLIDSQGRLTGDVRVNYYVPPGVADPFESAGIYVAPPRADALLNKRYLVIDALSHSPRGGVFRAVDLGPQPARPCLVKEYWHDVCSDQYGRDARGWARNEQRILLALADVAAAPRFIELFESAGNTYTAIEFLEGTPLGHGVSDDLAPQQVAKLGVTVAEHLIMLHDRGIVFRDLKPANVIHTSDGGYRLIDFGIAHDLAGTEPPLGIGTPEFCSPQQLDGDPPSVRDDVFAWGATLQHMAGDPGDRLAEVIDRAVARDTSFRYPDMRSALAEFRAAPTRTRRRREPRPANTPRPGGSMCPEEALTRATDAGTALLASAEARNGGLCWPIPGSGGSTITRDPDLYSGTAGIALFLTELGAATGEQRFADGAHAAARWLAGPDWTRGWSQHGLHGGEPGVAWLFLCMAELLDAPSYVTAAELRMRRLLGAVPQTVDILHGTAGTIIALLRLHAATGEAEYLELSRTFGDDLVAAAVPAPGGRRGRYWHVAPIGPGSPEPLLGLLHGAAGIGYALVELADATADDRYHNAACAAADLLLDQGRRAGGGGLVWPRRINDADAGVQAHCHGAGGIARFFLRLHRRSPERRYADAAVGAARAVAASAARQADSGLCHGLSGAGNLFLDCHSEFADGEWLVMARECARQLDRFAVPQLTGQSRSSIGGPVLPGLMLGYAGPASFLLRLSKSNTSERFLCI